MIGMVVWGCKERLFRLFLPLGRETHQSESHSETEAGVEPANLFQFQEVVSPYSEEVSPKGEVRLSSLLRVDQSTP